MVTISLENGDTITIEDNRTKSEEGFINRLKMSFDTKGYKEFEKLWMKEFGNFVSNDEVNRDYFSYIKAKDKNKSLTMLQFINNQLKEKYSSYISSNLSYEEKEKIKIKQKIEKLKKLENFPQIEARAKALADECVKIHTKANKNIESSKEVKELFKSTGVNYLDYLYDVDSQQKIVEEILSQFEPKDTKLEYLCYLVDMEGLRSQGDGDLYDDLGDDMYDVFENCIPAPSNKSKYEIDIGGLGWHTVCFTVNEK